ncbi:GreA/GreB family elongation factor [Agriterribacter sp.]|uniref:GreA/GreB family elongation factor n=1 Tax=Agriterribacter sp. TaxID=2821509 RepID=UPI002C681F67|nr:GreA/GreB family elongation factor [Agriterribacter sp.]HRO48218.1 GreA/GreB family elongation factor [Agriterribacter sp.]HRQ18737.1 GreA/GreB family elongation factor [Agriterribacter sp.]
MKAEKTPVLLCEEDYRLLKQLVGISLVNDMEEEMTLAYELSRAIVVKDNALPLHTIRLNSKVRVEDTATKKVTDLTIVMPPHADIKHKKISILTPMAAALIGFKKGDEVEWKMPSGLKKYKVLDVTNPVRAEQEA